jgi:hypothetical protein
LPLPGWNASRARSGGLQRSPELLVRSARRGDVRRQAQSRSAGSARRDGRALRGSRGAVVDSPSPLPRRAAKSEAGAAGGSRFRSRGPLGGHPLSRCRHRRLRAARGRRIRQHDERARQGQGARACSTRADHARAGVSQLHRLANSNRPCGPSADSEGGLCRLSRLGRGSCAPSRCGCAGFLPIAMTAGPALVDQGFAR